MLRNIRFCRQHEASSLWLLLQLTLRDAEDLLLLELTHAVHVMADRNHRVNGLQQRHMPSTARGRPEGESCDAASEALF